MKRLPFPLANTSLWQQKINRWGKVLFGISQVALVVKNPPANAGDRRNASLIPELERFPWRRAWQPTPIFLPGKSHEQRSLVGYGPQDRQQSDLTEATENTCIHVSIHFPKSFPIQVITKHWTEFPVYTVGSCWLSLLNISVYTCQSQTPNVSLLPTLPALVSISLFSKSMSVSVL